MCTQNTNAVTDAQITTGQKLAFIQSEAGVLFSYAMWHNAEWVSRWGMQTLAVLQRLYPDMLLLPVEEALALANSKHRTTWVEITEERYIEQLESLMPMDWHRTTLGESFKSMEMTGDVTTIYARRNGRFYECHDLFTLSHQDIMRGIDKAAGAPGMNKGH